MGDGVTFLTPPLAARNRDHRAFGASSCLSRPRPPMPTFSPCCGCFRPTSRKWCSRAPSIRTRRSARAGCAPRIAELDKKLSKPYRPYHSHTKKQPLKPGEVVALDIEIWPTSIVVPAGYRIALTVRGKDYVYPGGSGGRLSNFKNELTGCGPFLHDDPRDRPPRDFRRRHRAAFRRRRAALSAAAYYSAEETMRGNNLRRVLARRFSTDGPVLNGSLC